MELFEPSKETPMTVGVVKESGYSKERGIRWRIDSLSTNETFVLGGFTFRVEGELPAVSQTGRYPSYARFPRKSAWSAPEKSGHQTKGNEESGCD